MDGRELGPQTGGSCPPCPLAPVRAILRGWFNWKGPTATGPAGQRKEVAERWALFKGPHPSRTSRLGSAGGEEVQKDIEKPESK